MSRAFATSLIPEEHQTQAVPLEGISCKLPLDWSFIFRSDLPPGPRILYAYIVSKSDRDDTDIGVKIPMEVLGRTLNVSYATIWKHCQKLQQLGFLRIEQNSAGHNIYHPIHYWDLS